MRGPSGCCDCGNIKCALEQMKLVMRIKMLAGTRRAGRSFVPLRPLYGRNQSGRKSGELTGRSETTSSCHLLTRARALDMYANCRPRRAAAIYTSLCATFAAKFFKGIACASAILFVAESVDKIAPNGCRVALSRAAGQWRAMIVRSS